MVDIDLVSVASYAGSQPHEQFAWLREHAPVYRHADDGADGGFWAVTRYDDVKLVGRDHERFSSSPTIMLADSSGESAGLLGDHVMMLTADPPVHTRMRRLVSSRFTPRASSRLSARIDDLAGQIIDDVVEQGECDLVHDIAGAMPSYVIADMLGIPLQDGRDLYALTEALHSSEEVVTREERGAAFGEMLAYSQQVWADKRAGPTDDLASLIAHGEIAGEPVDAIDFFLWFLLLIDAGGDTTRNLVGAGFHELFAHESEFHRLRSEVDALLPSAIEELLRWTTPVIHMRRTATRDTELGGQKIAEGDRVVMFYGSANRDEACVDEPDRLDLGRAENPHVAFGGGGPHYCLGAHLARLEIASLMREMLTRLVDLRPTAEPTWMPSNFIFGPTSLPVAFTPQKR